MGASWAFIFLILFLFFAHNDGHRLRLFDSVCSVRSMQAGANDRRVQEKENAFQGLVALHTLTGGYKNEDRMRVGVGTQILRIVSWTLWIGRHYQSQHDVPKL